MPVEKTLRAAARETSLKLQHRPTGGGGGGGGGGNGGGETHWIPEKFPTSVYWLSNDVGSETWPATDDKVERFLDAFREVARR